MKTNKPLIIYLMFLAATIVAACILYVNPPRSVRWTVAQEDKLWQSNALASIGPCVSNVVPGIHAFIIESADFSTYHNPGAWMASVNVDYVNHLGGMDRTNLPLRGFLVGEHASFILDTDKISARQEATFRSHLADIAAGSAK